MSRRYARGVADDLTRDLYYLAAGSGDARGVVVVTGDDGSWAPVFSDAARARLVAAAAPRGVHVACSPAGDPRAREELLLACLDSGAEVLGVDASSAQQLPQRTASVRAALAAVRSHRTGSACL